MDKDLRYVKERVFVGVARDIFGVEGLIYK